MVGKSLTESRASLDMHTLIVTACHDDRFLGTGLLVGTQAPFMTFPRVAFVPTSILSTKHDVQIACQCFDGAANFRDVCFIA